MTDLELFFRTDFSPVVAQWILLAQEAAQPEPSFMERMLNNPLMLPVALVAIFYVTYFAPERRRKAEEAQKLASLQANDRVVTVGGLHGIIVSVSPDSDTVLLKIDENANTKVKVNRSAIATILKG